MQGNNSTAVEVYTIEEVIGMATFTALILILAIPTNALVLLAYLTSPSARRKPSNYLLVNFTISEFITAALVIPLQLVVHIVRPNLAMEDGTACKLVGVISYPFYIVSVDTMVFISIDRLYAIRWPLNYKTKMNAKRITGMIVYTWVHATTFALVFGFVIGVGHNDVSTECGIRWTEMHISVGLFIAITHIVLPFVLLTLLNYNLVAGLRKQNRTLDSHFEQHLSAMVDRVGTRKNKTRQAQERKVSNMVLWLITTYLICWIPYLITRIIYLTPATSTPLIDAIAVLVLHLSVVINPTLNLVFRKELRSNIQRLLCRRGRDVVFPMQGVSRTFMSAAEGDASTVVGNSRINSPTKTTDKKY